MGFKSMLRICPNCAHLSIPDYGCELGKDIKKGWSDGECIDFGLASIGEREARLIRLVKEARFDKLKRSDKDNAKNDQDQRSRV